jgi:hypothetical protein
MPQPEICTGEILALMVTKNTQEPPKIGLILKESTYARFVDQDWIRIQWLWIPMLIQK